MSHRSANKKSEFSSPLRYPGGKASLSRFLLEVLDKEKISDHVHFVEPYAGGAGASLQLLFSNRIAKITINDFDNAIFSFWKYAVDETDKFIRKIKKTPITTIEWRKQKEIYRRGKLLGKPTFKLAFATFFLNRTNRSGIIEGGPIGGFAQDGKWKIDARFNKESLIARFELLKQYRNRIIVRNSDGIKLLESLEKHKSKGNYYIFLDPPYIQKGQFLYLNHYEANDHERLAKFIQTTALKWIMTYDDTEYIRTLYKRQEVKSFNLFHSAYSMKQGKEVLISPHKIAVPVFR